MKQKTLVLLLLLVGVMVSSTIVGGTTSKKDDSVVIVVQHDDFNPNRPRNPIEVEIEAYYNAASSAVELILNSESEVVSVTIDNVSSTENYYFEVPGMGSNLLPISSSSGYWKLTILFEDGDIYWGSFTI